MKRDNSCVLTGVCYDNDILDPIYNFLLRPNENTNYENLMNDIEGAINKAFNDTEKWINSDEYIIDTILANEYEFTKDGNRF